MSINTDFSEESGFTTVEWASRRGKVKWVEAEMIVAWRGDLGEHRPYTVDYHFEFTFEFWDRVIQRIRANDFEASTGSQQRNARNLANTLMMLIYVIDPEEGEEVSIGFYGSHEQALTVSQAVAQENEA